MIPVKLSNKERRLAWKLKAKRLREEGYTIQRIQDVIREDTGDHIDRNTVASWVRKNDQNFPDSVSTD